MSENNVNSHLGEFDPFGVINSDIQISPRVVEAQTALHSKEIPAWAIKERQARGGKTLSYIDHIYGRETIQYGLPPTWSHELLSWEIFDDNSVHALVRFTYYIPYNTLSGVQWLERVVAEPGSYLNDMKMAKAFAVAAAASRGLMRCLMAMFGLGIQFYKDEHDEQKEINPRHAYIIAREAAKHMGMESKDVKHAMKKMGITEDNILDRFTDLMMGLKSIRDGMVVEHQGEPVNQPVTPPQQSPAPIAAQPSPEPVVEQVEPDQDEDVPEMFISEPEDEAVYAQNWKEVVLWMNENNFDTTQGRNMCMEHFGEFDKTKVSEYHKWLIGAFAN